MKNKITVIAFLLLVFSGFILSLILPDNDFSVSEKRELEQFETPTISTLSDGTWFSDFQTYTADQFPFREDFRALNSTIRLNAFNQNDVDGLLYEDGYIFKREYPLRTDNIERFATKTNEIYGEFIKDTADNYYVSVIPDKNYYMESDTLTANSKEIADIFASKVEGAEYIDIFGALNLDSYYKTDTHWSQDKLFDVMDIYSEKMEFANLDKNMYNSVEIEDFYGVYYGQLGLNIQPDTLVYMESEYTNTATVENLDKPEFNKVYDTAEFNSEDGYNVFLSGATPYIKIESPNSKTDKELVIFRDSFGSSIAPLFLENYRTVTLIDLRYFNTSQLENYVDFTGKDVLVLYSTIILNSNIVFR